MFGSNSHIQMIEEWLIKIKQEEGKEDYNGILVITVVKS